jgi:hypothetical protein
MDRTLVETIHGIEQPFWLFTVLVDGKPKEFCVYSPDIDSAIYEVLTKQNLPKARITSISKH